MCATVSPAHDACELIGLAKETQKRETNRKQIEKEVKDGEKPSERRGREGKDNYFSLCF